METENPNIYSGMEFEEQVGYLVDQMVRALNINEETFKSNLTNIILTREYDRVAIIQAEKEARMIFKNSRKKIMSCPLCDGDVYKVSNKEVEVNERKVIFNGGMCSNCESLIEESLINAN